MVAPLEDEASIVFAARATVTASHVQYMTCGLARTQCSLVLVFVTWQ
jgi:hypothetical protein